MAGGAATTKSAAAALTSQALGARVGEAQVDARRRRLAEVPQLERAVLDQRGRSADRPGAEACLARHHGVRRVAGPRDAVGAERVADAAGGEQAAARVAARAVVGQRAAEVEQV